MKVTKEDLEALLRTVDRNIEALDQGDIEAVKWSLEVLSSHLTYNLLKKGIKEVA